MATVPQKFEKIAFVASEVPEARSALATLTQQYGNVPAKQADAIVALGGDGLMLQTLHKHMNDRIPIYGMNRGSVGFLTNDYHVGRPERTARPRRGQYRSSAGDARRRSCGQGAQRPRHQRGALFRETYQAAKLKISVDGKVRLEELICDGALVATPAGSTAYNLSVFGPILPINAPLLALTPISAFRPRRWRGALLPNAAKIVFEVLEAEKRPVSAVADHNETRSVTRVEVEQADKVDLLMMFDPGHSLDERILSEQFRY